MAEYLVLVCYSNRGYVVVQQDITIHQAHQVALEIVESRPADFGLFKSVTIFDIDDAIVYRWVHKQGVVMDHTASHVAAANALD